ncbi:MAG: hypothetical protein A4E46_01342 [Methanosaeta sp. PtaU1.Bin016]|nr:MAG: hypothetical protein A4E46_01342 [Methanosaeta sp. PtaU1.Bin016]
MAIVEDLIKANAGLLLHGHADGPVIEGRAEGDVSLIRIQLPAGFVLHWVHSFNEPVDISYDLEQTRLHVLLLDLQLIDHAVYFIDEQHRAHAFTQCLSQHCLSLRHCAFNCVYDHHCAVHGSHSPGDVASKVNVARSVDHVDQILLAIYLVNHGHICSIDGNSTRLLQGIEVHEELLACQVHGDHSCTT